MQTLPLWRECDTFIYCRVNLANALIARMPPLPQRTLRNHGCAAGVRRSTRTLDVSRALRFH